MHFATVSKNPERNKWDSIMPKKGVKIDPYANGAWKDFSKQVFPKFIQAKIFAMPKRYKKARGAPKYLCRSL